MTNINDNNDNDILYGDTDPDDEGMGPKRKEFADTFGDGDEYKVHHLRNYEGPGEVSASTVNLNATCNERLQIIDQAIELIEDVYVHLPLKQAMHAVDPIQCLKLLKYRCAESIDDNPNEFMDDRTFHSRMLSIFNSLRDLHTTYILPSPYKHHVAFLPFLIEEYYVDGKRRYMVSKIFSGKIDGHDNFEEGVTITHWNGRPIDRAVELNGECNPGSNESARHARGLDRMTIRPLRNSLPPDEHWVEIKYQPKDDGPPESLKLKWYVAMPEQSAGSGSDSPDAEIQTAMGIDLETEIGRRVKRRLFWRAGNTEGIANENTALAFLKPSREMPNVFAYGRTRERDFGYIRIYTFDVSDATAFVDEFFQLVKEFSNAWGLIIDVRGNGGGLITAGEQLLQALANSALPAKKFEPERFHFINTPTMLKVCSHKKFSQWAESIRCSIKTGAVYSQGYPLLSGSEFRSPNKLFNNIVLITDALCYSATDIFAAGFKDNNIGRILGVNGNTGAGGANVWPYSVLKKYLPGMVAAAAYSPGKTGKDWDFRVAVRRATRVGANSGMPLEGLGVEIDETHRMTRDDLLFNNMKLIEKAESMFPPRRTTGVNWLKKERGREEEVKECIPVENKSNVIWGEAGYGI